jgi:S-adenosylmethionine synthetase
MRVIITGASGLLGSAVHRAFLASTAKPEILALSHTRSGDGLTPINLLDLDNTEGLFQQFKPEWIIHCAAERRPDIAEKVPDVAYSKGCTS